MKRLFCSVMCLGLLIGFGALVGCGDTKTEKKTTTETKTIEKKTEEKKTP